MSGSSRDARSDGGQRSSARICPDDGYPMERGAGGSGADWICTNPWHPLHPGPCPKCGSEGHHEAGPLGAVEVVCAACGHVWPGPVGG